VLDFGAVGDGVTDNAGAVSKALSQALGQDAILFFPPGSYYFNQSFAPEIIAPAFSFSLAGVTGESRIMFDRRPDSSFLDFEGSNLSSVEPFLSEGSVSSHWSMMTSTRCMEC
jgi:hypothetical protein